MLIDSLLAPELVEVRRIRCDHSPELPLPEDQQVIQTAVPSHSS